MFGVCTSLGLGVMQVNAGLNRMRPEIEVGETTQIIIIWCITAREYSASGVEGLNGPQALGAPADFTQKRGVAEALGPVHTGRASRFACEFSCVQTLCCCLQPV